MWWQGRARMETEVRSLHSSPWSLIKETPGRSTNMKKTPLKFGREGLLLQSHQFGPGQSASYIEGRVGVKRAGAFLVSGPASAICLFSDFGQVNCSLTKCLWYWHMPHRVTQWNKEAVKWVGQWPKGLTAWSTFSSGCSPWAGYCVEIYFWLIS